MRTLTPQAFQRAKSYIFDQGRELEQRLFETYFLGGPPEHVLAALAIYQNEDGGFGQALEPDLRTMASSAVATQHAFQLCREMKAPSTEPLVQRGIAYLLRTYDPARGAWPIIPPAAEDAPHAPWWNYTDSAQNFGGFLANPRAALVGYLYDYRELVPADFLAQVTNALITHLEAAPPKMEMHDLQCYVNLAETVRLSPAVKNRIREKLGQIVHHSVELDSTQWANYGLPPLGVVKAPDHFLAASIPAATLAANLDFLLDQQQSDGAWAPTWQWSFVDEAAWQAAEKEWKSYLTLANLKLLHEFGRVASTA